MSKAKPITNIFGTGEASAWNPGAVPPAQKEQAPAPAKTAQVRPTVSEPASATVVPSEPESSNSAETADREFEVEAAAARKPTGKKKLGRPAKRDRTEPMTVRMPLDLYERLATEARKAKGLRVTTPQQVLINILRAHYEGGAAATGDTK